MKKQFSQRLEQEIRNAGYTGSIPECKCGWVGTLNETESNKKGIACCPNCKKEIVQEVRL